MPQDLLCPRLTVILKRFLSLLLSSIEGYDFAARVTVSFAT
jgi:hypothetical protein